MRCVFPSLVFLAACTMNDPMQRDPAPGGRLLVDFAAAEEGGRWNTVLDGVMGGRSTGSFAMGGDRMVFTGVLNTNGGGFSSVRRSAQDLGLGRDDEAGIHLRVRGDGRAYTLRLRQPAPSLRVAASYRASFATEDLRASADPDAWQDVFVRYADLTPTWRGRTLDLPAIDPAAVDEIGVSIDDKIDGPFHIELRAIGTFAAPQRGK